MMGNKFLRGGFILSIAIPAISVIACNDNKNTIKDNKINQDNIIQQQSSKYEPLAPGVSISKLSLNDLMVYSSIGKNALVGDWIGEERYVRYNIFDGQLFIDNYLIYQKSNQAKNLVVSKKQYDDILIEGYLILVNMYEAKKGFFSKKPKSEWPEYFKSKYEPAREYYKYFKNSSIKDKISLEYEDKTIQWV